MHRMHTAAARWSMLTATTPVFGCRLFDYLRRIVTASGVNVNKRNERSFLRPPHERLALLKYRWEHLAKNAWHCCTRGLMEISLKTRVAVNVLREREEMTLAYAHCSGCSRIGAAPCGQALEAVLR